jgi:hypothetical protein
MITPDTALGRSCIDVGALAGGLLLADVVEKLLRAASYIY